MSKTKNNLKEYPAMTPEASSLNGIEPSSGYEEAQYREWKHEREVATKLLDSGVIRSLLTAGEQSE